MPEESISQPYFGDTSQRVAQHRTIGRILQCLRRRQGRQHSVEGGNVVHQVGQRGACVVAFGALPRKKDRCGPGQADSRTDAAAELEGAASEPSYHRLKLCAQVVDVSLQTVHGSDDPVDDVQQGWLDHGGWHCQDLCGDAVHCFVQIDQDVVDGANSIRDHVFGLVDGKRGRKDHVVDAFRDTLVAEEPNHASDARCDRNVHWGPAALGTVSRRGLFRRRTLP